MIGFDAKVTDANQRRFKGCLGWTTSLRSMRNMGSAGGGGVAGALCIRVLYPNIRLGRCCGRGDVQACVAVVVQGRAFMVILKDPVVNLVSDLFGVRSRATAVQWRCLSQILVRFQDKLLQRHSN